MSNFAKLSLFAHRHAPAWLRRAYRLSKSFSRVELSPQLPPDLMKNYRVCCSRHFLLELLPSRGVVAELGTQRGNFARHILAKADPRELHLVDLSYALFDEAGLPEPRVKRHQGQTFEIIAAFPNAYFDWIYVDADHSYEGVRRDANAAAPKVKPGGFLVFNDFAHIDPYLGRYGVHRAVTEFALKNKWPFRHLAYDVAGLYDVAIQKPN